MADSASPNLLCRPPRNHPGRFLFFSELFGKNLCGNRPRKSSKNEESHSHRGTQHDHSHILRDWQATVAKDRSKKTKGSAGGAQSEIDALPQASRDRHQPGKNRGDHHINPDQDKVARGSRCTQDPCLRRSKSMKRNAQEHKRVDQSDDRPLAAVQNPKVIHKRRI